MLAQPDLGSPAPAAPGAALAAAGLSAAPCKVRLFALGCHRALRISLITEEITDTPRVPPFLPQPRDKQRDHREQLEIGSSSPDGRKQHWRLLP